MAKKFSRVAAVPKKAIAPPQVTDLAQVREKKVINLERVDLSDRENWLRALELCKATSEVSLDGLLKEIGTYQGQIDQALQTAQAQSTIYAYAIGTRLDVIEDEKLFEAKGFSNLTGFIKAGEVKRPNGKSITTRQVWAYRSVTRGLNEFLELAEEIRAGRSISTELKTHFAALGEKVNQNIVEAFLDSYSEVITGVLELGVSKLEQMYRLPKPVAFSSLLSGKLALEEEVIEVHEVPFSALRKAISTHEKKDRPKAERKINVDGTLDHLRQCVRDLKEKDLNQKQRRRLKELSDVILAMLD
ncbi:MAG: hypothetical protein AAFR58_16175 [Cyanobacteria bacterium J06627_28]